MGTEIKACIEKSTLALLTLYHIGGTTNNSDRTKAKTEYSSQSQHKTEKKKEDTKDGWDKWEEKCGLAD